jgi:F-type H+-transporting ATPase subunit b
MRNKKIWLTLGILLSVGLSLAAEHGAAQEEGGLESPSVLIWKGINILIVVGALVYFFKEPFLKWVEDYKNQIIKNVNEAEEEFKKAKEELENAKKALEEAKIKYEESIKVAHETAEIEKQQIIARAKEIAERIKEKAEKTIEVETNKAKEELRKYAAQKAIVISEKMLREVFADPETQKKFAERMLSDLSKN